MGHRESPQVCPRTGCRMATPGRRIEKGEDTTVGHSSRLSKKNAIEASLVCAQYDVPILGRTLVNYNCCHFGRGGYLGLRSMPHVSVA